MPEAFWIVALAALSIVGHGHNFAVGNHVIYLAWIERLRDPAFLLNDWYLSTPIMHENIVRPLRHLGDWLGDANAFLTALFLARLILVAGVWRLARILGGGVVAAALATALVILAPRVSWGGHYPSGSYFEASHLGMALAIAAFGFLLKRQLILAGIAIGLAGHVHIFVGAHTGVIASLALLIDPSWKGRKISPVLRLSLPALAVAGYTIVNAATGYFSSTSAESLSGRDVVEILCFRHPHHHSPLSWDLGPCAQYAAYVAIGMTLAWKNGRFGSPFFRALAVYELAAIVIGTVFVEWLPVSLVALFQFFRMTVLLTIWIAIEVALWLARLCDRKRSGATSWVAAALSAAAILSFRIPVVFLSCATLLGVLSFFARKPNEDSPGDSSAFFCACFRVLAAPTSAACLLLLLLGAAGFLNPAAAKLGRANHFRLDVESPSESTRELCQWVKDNTPSDVAFVAPPGVEGFKIYARRSDVVSFKMMTFTRPDLREWFERVCRVSKLDRLTPDAADDPDAVLSQLHRIRTQGEHPQIMLDEGFRLLEEDDVTALAERYGASYFITDRRTPYTFSLAGAAGGFKIYRLPVD